MADVKSRDVPDSWLLFGRVKIMVGDAADVPFEPFHGFVVIVGGSWPCGTEFETHAQEGLSSGGNRCFLQRLWKDLLEGRPTKSTGDIRR